MNSGGGAERTLQLFINGAVYRECNVNAALTFAVSGHIPIADLKQSLCDVWLRLT